MQKLKLTNFNNQSGVTLVESLLVIIIVSAIAMLIANIPNSISLINKSKHLSIAKEIAAKAIEDKRSMDYLSLADGSNTPITDSRVILLPSGSAVITVADCGVPICANSEIAKTISVIISWKEAAKQQSFKIDTLISKGGF